MTPGLALTGLGYFHKLRFLVKFFYSARAGVTHAASQTINKRLNGLA